MRCVRCNNIVYESNKVIIVIRNFFDEKRFINISKKKYGIPIFVLFVHCIRHIINQW